METIPRSRDDGPREPQLTADRLRAWRYDSRMDVLLITDGEPHVTTETDVGEGVVILKDVDDGRAVGLRITGMRAHLLRTRTGNRPGRARSRDRRERVAHDLIEMAARATGPGLWEPDARIVGTHEHFDRPSGA